MGGSISAVLVFAAAAALLLLLLLLPKCHAIGTSLLSILAPLALVDLWLGMTLTTSYPVIDAHSLKTKSINPKLVIKTSRKLHD